MDLPLEKNIIFPNKETDSNYKDLLESNKKVIHMNEISNFKLNVNKLEYLKINHHICNNTTGESKNPCENYNQFKDENLNFEKFAEENLEENNGTEGKTDNKKNEIQIKKDNNFYSFSSLENKIIFPLLGRKIFRIKKYTRYNKYLNEICTDSDASEEEKKKLKDQKIKKISPFSKVNFSKLKIEEKDERLKNLAKLVKKLRRKTRNLENKIRFNASKLLNKYIWTKLGINTKNKYNPPEFSFDFDKICKALKRAKNHEDFEFADEKHLIENLINLISEDKLKLDSLGYKRICSQIRMLLDKDQIKYISKKNTKVTVSFPESDVFITKTEFNYLKKYKDKEEILRAILGVYDQDEKTIKISIENLNEENIDEKVEVKESKVVEKPFFRENIQKNSKDEKSEFNNKIISKGINDKNVICNNNINQSFLHNIDQIINYKNGNNQMNMSIFPNYINNIENNRNNEINFKHTNKINDQLNLDKNNFGNYQNNIFGVPLNQLNNIQAVDKQENFPFNLMKNTNLLDNMNCLDGSNYNINNYLNPMQMLLLNNPGRNINQNPQYFNNYMMKQNNLSTIPYQIEANMFPNFNYSNGNLNNNALKSPKKDNFFFNNQNCLNNYNPGNINIFTNKDKSQNSSYNVFLK